MIALDPTHFLKMLCYTGNSWDLETLGISEVLKTSEV